MAETTAQAVEHIRSAVLKSSLDEAATKQSIVLRLLGLCGWDLFDLSSEQVQYRQ